MKFEDCGYTVISREADDCRTHTLLLLREPVVVVSPGAWYRRDKETGRLSMEACHAVCKFGDPGNPTSISATISSVYNYGPQPQHMAEYIQKIADQSSGGNVIAGGDWNMARSLDSNRELKHLGTASFDRLAASFGWTNILPGDGQREIPTWRFSNLRKPLTQPDHLFVRLPADVRVKTDVEAPVRDSAMLSDHAILHAHVEFGSG